MDLESGRPALPGRHPDCRSRPRSPASVGGGAQPVPPGPREVEGLDEGSSEAPARYPSATLTGPCGRPPETRGEDLSGRNLKPCKAPRIRKALSKDVAQSPREFRKLKLITARQQSRRLHACAGQQKIVR